MQPVHNDFTADENRPHQWADTRNPSPAPDSARRRRLKAIQETLDAIGTADRDEQATAEPPARKVAGGAKRPREESNNNDWGQGKKHKHRGERPHKVLPCKFFQKGTCNKGDNCTYVHDVNM